MASIHRHSSGRSKYWYAKFRGPDGTPSVKSTKCTDRQKALAIAIEYEKVARKAQSGVLAEAQASCFPNRTRARVLALAIWP
jgi:hypothetical protein